MSRTAMVLPPAEQATLRALHVDTRRTAKGSAPRRRLNGYIWLLHAAGWTMDSIAAVLGVSRQAIEHRLAAQRDLLGLPTVVRAGQEPVGTPPGPPRRKLRVRPEIAQRLRDMHTVAQTVNGATPAADPSREVSVELSATLAQLARQGVAIYELAAAMGVTCRAITARLERHGYRPHASSYRDTYIGQPTGHRQTA